MKKLEYDPEIIYVQKLYFFFFFVIFFLILSVAVYWRLGRNSALAALALGMGISYLAMLKKKSFPPPAKKVSAQRIAKEISHQISPLVVSRFASQLCFYFDETELAISLLEKFLPTGDPLVCATLSDILIREGQIKRALSILHENPQALVDPLLLSIQGHIYKKLERIPEAIKMYERSLYFAKKKGFPHNGASPITQYFLTLSYTASIHHALGDCHTIRDEYTAAKRHYWAGNLRLLDVTLWRYPKPHNDFSTKNYRKYQ